MPYIFSYSLPIHIYGSLVKELAYNNSMPDNLINEEEFPLISNAINELKLDIIEITNPIGEVLEEIEARFERFKKEL